MPQSSFSHVTEWVFDLDNTLYAPSARLFDQIEVRMAQFVMHALKVDLAEANRLRRAYWRQYGTTLAGLMQVHGIEPGPYLDEVHQIDLSALAPDPDLAAALTALPGRKIVFTNGPRAHAQRVCAARGLGGVFDAMYGVEDAGFAPKPLPEAFARVFDLAALHRPGAAMFEDDPRNLAVPRAMGLKCVHVTGDDDSHISTGGHPPAPHDLAHAHFSTDDLTGFLQRLA